MYFLASQLCAQNTEIKVELINPQETCFVLKKYTCCGIHYPSLYFLVLHPLAWNLLQSVPSLVSLINGKIHLRKNAVFVLNPAPLSPKLPPPTSSPPYSRRGVGNFFQLQARKTQVGGGQAGARTLLLLVSLFAQGKYLQLALLFIAVCGEHLQKVPLPNAAKASHLQDRSVAHGPYCQLLSCKLMYLKCNPGLIK